MLFKFWRLNCNSRLREIMRREFRVHFHLSKPRSVLKCLPSCPLNDFKCSHKVFLLGGTSVLLWLHSSYCHLFNCIFDSFGDRRFLLHSKLFNRLGFGRSSEQCQEHIREYDRGNRAWENAR
jgi:hypothetical protein